MADQDDFYTLCGSKIDYLTISCVSCDKEGRVKVEFKNTEKLNPDGAKPNDIIRVIDTTADGCSWNLSATKKPLQWHQQMGRPRFVDMTSDQSAFRVGSQVFLSQPGPSGSELKAFSPKEFSLCLDRIEQRGRYLFVTSRQKVTEVPKVEEEEAPKPEDSASKDGPDSTSSETVKPDEKVAKSSNESVKSSDNQVKEGIIEESKTDNTKKSDNSDSDSESDGNASETSVAEEDLSAYESWSEASTDLEEAGVYPIDAIRPLPTALSEAFTRGKQDSDADSSSSSSDEENDSHHCSSCSSSDDESVSGSNKRYEKNYDIEETWRMSDQVYLEDRDGPGSNESGDDGDDCPDGAWDDHGYALFGSDDDFDGFQAVESDSEECSECGGDDGKACPLPSEDNTAVETEDKEDDEIPLPGMAFAQIHVYDTSSPSTDDDGKLELKRVFRFERPTTETPLHDSAPAVHPSKPLLVWPVGDVKSSLVFVDYEYNSYFLKKIRLSRLFSRHVAVQCHFSRRGDYLHVAALERWGNPPRRVKKVKKRSEKSSKTSKEQKQKKKEKKEAPRYDLLVSTYRMSKGKTTRAPPVLVHQIKQHVGQIAQTSALPTYTWQDENVLVTYASETHVNISSISLLPAPRSRKAQAGTQPVKTTSLPIDTVAGLAENELVYLQQSEERDSYTILALEPPHLKQYIEPKEKKEDDSAAKPENEKKKTDELTVHEKPDAECIEPPTAAHPDGEVETNGHPIEEKQNGEKCSSSSASTNLKNAPNASTNGCVVKGCSALRVLKLNELML